MLPMQTKRRRTTAGRMAHDIAQVVRRRASLEDEIVARVDALDRRLAGIEEQITGTRKAVEPLERSMVAVRDSVDELEPMIADLDTKIRTIEPRLAEMQDSVEPIGDLAERIPGGRRRRSG